MQIYVVYHTESFHFSSAFVRVVFHVLGLSAKCMLLGELCVG